jgi:hypothetical protein
LIAEQGGYVKETPDGPGFWKVSLTDKGEKALAAGDIKTKPVPARKGCDYQTATFIVGAPELVRITSVVSHEDSTEVAYTYSTAWVVTCADCKCVINCFAIARMRSARAAS